MDVDLILNQDHCECEVPRGASGCAVVYSAKSPDRAEDPNEDSAAVFRIDEERSVLAVADGLGGRPGGARASKIALETLGTAIRTALAEDQKLRVGILNGIERANQAVLELGIGAATTLAAVQIQGRRVRSYHVGDSMILVTGQRGRIKLQPAAHSPVGYAVEGGFLEEETAIYHEDRHLVSNMIGATDMHIEIGSTLTLSRRDTLLLASDGLADNLRTDEIVKIIRTGVITAAARVLAETAASRMQNPSPDHPSKPDDLTFVLYRPGPPA